MKNYAKVAALLGLSAVTLSASGYRIPEQSLNSTALSAAYVAGANGADASYFNPANMVWNDDGSEMETALTYIGLSKVKFKDNGSAPLGTGTTASDTSSLSEKFFVPTFHYVSPAVGDWRFGLSMVAPGGLSKRWDDEYAKSTSEEFTLSVIEINPTVAYKVSDKFAIGFGLRGVYSDGIIKSNANNLLTREMEADSIDFGYNLAVSYKPIENLTFATTYRSKVDLTLEGNAKLKTVIAGGAAYDGDASLIVPLPASLALALAYTMSKTTVEFVFERTYWSAYKELDFKYPTVLPGPVLPGSFDDPKAKDWKDVNAYRIGVTHQYSDTLKLMAAFAIDKNPAPDSSLGFELPDSDAKLYSVGMEYKLNKDMKIGLAYLYDDKESRTISEAGGIKGTFTDSAAHLVTASFKYRF